MTKWKKFALSHATEAAQSCFWSFAMTGLHVHLEVRIFKQAQAFVSWGTTWLLRVKGLGCMEAFLFRVLHGYNEGITLV